MDWIAGVCVVSLPQSTRLMSESHPKKRVCLRMQFGYDAVMSNDVAELGKGMIHQHLMLPSHFFQEVGVVCISSCKLNQNAAGNLDCVQREIGATGKAYKYTCACIAVRSPAIISMECVEGLRQCSSQDKNYMSDVNWIIAQHRQMGYGAICLDMDAKGWGAWAARCRLYWGGL